MESLLSTGPTPSSFYWVTTWPRPLFCYKRVHTSPARLAVRAFQSCQGGCQLLWVVRVLPLTHLEMPEMCPHHSCLLIPAFSGSKFMKNKLSPEHRVPLGLNEASGFPWVYAGLSWTKLTPGVLSSSHSGRDQGVESQDTVTTEAELLYTVHTLNSTALHYTALDCTAI